VSVLALSTILVRDYDEAVAFYTAGLGLEVLEDNPQAGGRRWVVVGSRAGGGALRLALARTPEQQARVGDQCGGAVAFFLHVEDLDAALAAAVAHGAVATEEPRDEPHGRVVIVEDPYGNRWDVIQP
jgi:predicted enzyme related to lactoylglutathione lyase